jgi:hypothetical protein
VSRTGGTPTASEFVDATALGELTSDLLAAAGLSAQSGERRP